MKKYHYVYRITNLITGYHYYGSRSCNSLPKDDIGRKYFSSSSNKFFIEDQLNNPNDYKYKIIKIFETNRFDATNLEILLHKKFNVRNHEKFINRANQTSAKFIISNKNFKIRSKYEKYIISLKMVSTRMKKNSYQTGGLKSIKTRMTTKNNNSELTILEEAHIKARLTKLQKYGSESYINSEKIKETIKNRTDDEKKILKNKMRDIRLKKDENGKSLMDKLTEKASEKDTVENRKNRIAKGMSTKIKNGTYAMIGAKILKTKMENNMVWSYEIFDYNNVSVFTGIITELQKWCKLNNGSWYAFEDSAKNNGAKLYQFKGSKKFRHFKDYYCIRSR